MAGSAPDRLIWMDGRLVPWADATVHLLSHSLQRGSLIFDYMSIHQTPRGPAVFRMPEHVERFLRSAELVGLPLRAGAEALQAAVLETVRANPGATSAKICAYVPSIEVDVVPRNDHVAVAVAAYSPARDIMERLPAGPPSRATLRLWIEKRRRNRRDDILAPQAKAAAQYLSPMGAKWEAVRNGYDEVVLLDDEGMVAECPTANVFFVDADGTLRTPPEAKVLHGISRLSVLEIAKHGGIPVEVSPARPEDLMAAEEAFLSATPYGVWPAESVDGRALAAGAPGPVTQRLRERFQQIVAGRDPAFEHWLTPVAEG